MMLAKTIWVAMLGLLLLGCGSSSSMQPTATGTWRALLTSPAAQPGQQGEQAVFTLSFAQQNSTLNGTVLSLVTPSSCFPLGPNLSGTPLSGQVHLPGGEAIQNLQLSITLPSAGTTTPVAMTGAMQSDANSAAGIYILKSGVPASCSSAAGSFTLTRLPKE
jgi:hypothetical protein